MHEHDDTHLENIRERIARDGPVAETIRQAHVEQLKSHMAAFYEHGSTMDIIALCRAFSSLEQKEFSFGDLYEACLVESVLAQMQVTVEDVCQRLGV